MIQIKYGPRCRREDAVESNYKVICEKDLNAFSGELIEAAVNCTVVFNIRFAAIFEHFHVASISVCFHGHIARPTVRKFLLHIQPQVQP
jgi:hypothetical protein